MECERCGSPIHPAIDPDTYELAWIHDEDAMRGGPYWSCAMLSPDFDFWSELNAINHNDPKEYI